MALALMQVQKEIQEIQETLAQMVTEEARVQEVAMASVLEMEILVAVVVWVMLAVAVT
jgi:hypothetical protein